MKRAKLYVFVMSVMLASGMGVLNAQGRGAAKPLTEDQKKIQAIQKELAGLDKEQEAIEAKTTELVKTGERLIARAEAGKSGLRVLNGMVNNHTQRGQALSARISEHNSRCQGTFEDQAFVNACNSAAATLRNQAAVLDQEAQKLNEMRTGLREGQVAVSNETLLWVQANKDNDARQQKLDEDRANLRARTLTLLEDLKRRAKLSKECQAMAEDPTKGEDYRLERAHRCFQQVWDGAR